MTDANLVLGYLPTSLAGGEITLDTEAARSAVQKVADAMGLASAEEAAAGIIDIVNENMLGGLRLVSVQQGFDPRDFALVAFGGAGPLHANALGKLTGAWPVIVPPSPGVLCALGDATTSARDESARTCLRRFADLTGGELAAILRDLSSAAAAGRGRPGGRRRRAAALLPGGRPVLRAGLRYPVSTSTRPGCEDPDEALRTIGERFDAEHERLFSFVLTVDHELVNARASVSGPRPRVTPTELEPGTGDPAAARTGQARIYVDGGWRDAARYDRAAAAGRRRAARPGHRHRDGLHHLDPARPRRHRRPLRQPADPPRRRREQ